ncbi:MAG: hypothetical protein HY282_16755 [Nitrospirae bacterium]|nr:hypothetical protein [Candidatus Manganitrophaceae bacterium]
MKVIASKPVKIRIGDQVRSIREGETVEIPDERVEKALPYIRRGIFRLVNTLADFEKMKWDLWPKLAHCAWGKLTDAEKDRWEVAILIQGEAEKEGNAGKWQEMADILLEIAEAVATRRRESEHGNNKEPVTIFLSEV